MAHSRRPAAWPSKLGHLGGRRAGIQPFINLLQGDHLRIGLVGPPLGSRFPAHTTAPENSTPITTPTTIPLHLFWLRMANLLMCYFMFRVSYSLSLSQPAHRGQRVFSPNPQVFPDPQRSFPLLFLHRVRNKKTHPSSEKWGFLDSSILLPPGGSGGEIGRWVALFT